MLDTTQIKTEVLALMEDTRKWCSQGYYIDYSKIEFSNEMSEKYIYLYTNSKTLFERCIQGDINLNYLDYILEMIQKVNSGSNYNNVSQEVGQKMVDIYVKPMLDKK
jgi:hypothetical protein